MVPLLGRRCRSWSPGRRDWGKRCSAVEEAVQCRHGRAFKGAISGARQRSGRAMRRLVLSNPRRSLQSRRKGSRHDSAGREVPESRYGRLFLLCTAAVPSFCLGEANPTPLPWLNCHTTRTEPFVNPPTFL